MRKLKKRHLISAFIVLIFILSIATNPTKQEYLQFIGWEERPEIPENIHIQLERVNFFMFSTYTPIVAHESGITHLGIFGHFYQISNGQFDYPWLLEFFN